MIKKILSCAIFLASATAFAQHHHHGGYDGDMTKAHLSKVKFKEDGSKEKLKCHDHGRLFSSRRYDVGVCQASKHSSHADWVVVRDDGSYGSIGRNCRLDSSYGWDCRRWNRIKSIEFSTSHEERLDRRDIRGKIAR